jgi:hypothetical protein
MGPTPMNYENAFTKPKGNIYGHAIGHNEANAMAAYV